MALSQIRTKEGWIKFLKQSGIPQEDANKYAQKLHYNRITYPEDVDKDILKELKINTVGDQIAILNKSN